jgi:hypothetical protein
MKTPPAERFWAKVDGGNVSECWTWTARRLNGYGTFMLANRVAVIAHRWAYEQLIAPIPEGLDLDHLCRNRACVNPWHLEPVSRGENLRRGYAARGLKALCSNGHPFNDINTFRRSDGGRGCRTCRNNASRAAKARTRALVARPAQPNTESRTA